MQSGQSGRTSLSRKIIVNKKTQADKLMSQVDDDGILEWIRQKLNSDKTLRLAFENDLINNQVHMDASFFEKQYKAALKTIIGRKKYATAGEFPKLLEILKPNIETALTTIFDAPKNKGNQELYLALMKTTSEMEYLPKRPTTRFKTFIKKCINHCLPTIPANPKHIYELANCLLTADHNLLHSADVFYSVMENYGLLLDKAQRCELVKKRLEPILKYVTSEKITTSYLALVQTLEIFTELAPTFNLIGYQNKYNKALLDALWNHELYNQLRAACNKGLQENTAKYQGVYFDYLILLTEQQNDHAELFQVIMYKLKNIPAFADYKLLFDLKLNSKQQKLLEEYSEKIVLSSNYGAYYDYIQMKFYYWNHKKQFQNILDKLNDKPRVMYALKYIDELWELNHDQLLAKTGAAFKYSDFMPSKLKDTVKMYVLKKLKSLSGKDQAELSEKALAGLHYLDL